MSTRARPVKGPASPGPAGWIRRHPVATGISAVLVAAVLIFVLMPWSLVSRARADDAEIRSAVAPVGERLEPMSVPPPVSGWHLRVAWLCQQIGVAGNPLVPVCENVFPPIRDRSLDFSFRSADRPGAVCRLVRSLLTSSQGGCVAGEKRFGARFFQLDGTLSHEIVADVQVRRALVAPGGGIVDPEHPHPGAILATVVSLNASVRG